MYDMMGIVALDNFFLIMCIQTVNVPVVKLDEVVDATGAGDAFMGGLIAGNLEYLSWSVG